MKSCLRIIWTSAFIFSLQQTGSSGQAIDINTTSVVECQCRQKLTIRCYGPKNLFVDWQIAESVMPNTSSSAECYAGRACTVYNNFNGRYAFNYDQATGISDLSISHVNSKDHEQEYKCNDGTSQPFKLTVNFTGKPDFDLFINRTEPSKTNEHRILLILETNCTTPATSDVVIIWYSMAEDGSDYKVHNSTFSNVTQCTESDCRTRNTLSAIEVQDVMGGKLRRKRALGEGRIFGASFKSVSTLPNITFSGRYKMIESTPGIHNVNVQIEELNSTITYTLTSLSENTSTISTTTSVSSFSSSSTENIKTTNSTEIYKPSNPKPGNEHETYADETSTILIAAFSSIAGISFLLITGFAINKVRKRRNLRSNAANMHEMKANVK